MYNTRKGIDAVTRSTTSFCSLAGNADPKLSSNKDDLETWKDLHVSRDRDLGASKGTDLPTRDGEKPDRLTMARSTKSKKYAMQMPAKANGQVQMPAGERGSCEPACCNGHEVS